MVKPLRAGGHGPTVNERDLYKVMKDNAQVVGGDRVFQQPLARLARLIKLNADETRRLLGALESRGAIRCVKAPSGPDKYVLDTES